MKKLITIISSLVIAVIFTSFSVTERTSCYIKEDDTSIEILVEFPKTKTQRVFSVVNKHTENVFALNTSNPNVREKKHINNTYVLQLQSTNKKIFIKAIKKENDTSTKTKLTNLLEELKPIINN